MSASRRDVLAGAAAVTAIAGSPAVATMEAPRYMGVHYQFWTPVAPHDYIMFVQRFENRAAVDFKIVGASLHGGPINFLDDAEAEMHCRAIHDAHLVECSRVRRMHIENAERSIALHRNMGLSHDAALIHAHYKRAAERQLAKYQSDVRGIIEDRRNRIGPSYPTLARELYAQVMASQKMA